MTSSWRDKYRVHPACAVFPPLSDEELKALGEDIKVNGLKSPIVFLDAAKPVLIDGCNRLEAMQRAGVNWLDAVAKNHKTIWQEKDAIAYIISANIHRRHLSQQQRADIIVAVAKGKAEDKPRHDGEVSVVPSARSPSATDCPTPAVAPKGGRGQKNPVKEQALKINRSLPKEQQVGDRTLERAMAKAEGRTPEPSRIAGPKLSSRPKDMQRHVGIDAARRFYLERCAERDVDLDAEREMILEAFQELAGKRAAMSGTAATAPPASYPEMPDFLDRRQR